MQPMTAKGRGAPALRPHKLRLRADATVPRYWHRQQRLTTHLFNALGLIFPAGERFFIRTALEALPHVTDATLLAQVRGFIAQESHHAVEHERVFRVLEEQGLPAAELARSVERLLERMGELRLSLEVRLGVVAALEHFTATLAEFAFARDVLDSAHPAMRELFLWHAAEEIEHQCVAFDLFRSVDASQRTKLLGLAIASPVLLALWWGMAGRLYLEDRPLRLRSALRELLHIHRTRQLPLRAFSRAVLTYMHPRFHPSQGENLGRVAAYFTAAG